MTNLKIETGNIIRINPNSTPELFLKLREYYNVKENKDIPKFRIKFGNLRYHRFPKSDIEYGCIKFKNGVFKNWLNSTGQVNFFANNANDDVEIFCIKKRNIFNLLFETEIGSDFDYKLSCYYYKEDGQGVLVYFFYFMEQPTGVMFRSNSAGVKIPRGQ